MAASGPASEIFLRPGEFYFGGQEVRIRTILGSCVAITLWHPLLRVGGMCHYMLSYPHHARRAKLDGRYAEDAIQMFMREIMGRKTRPHEYETKVFGGGNMFPGISKTEDENIGQRNLQAGQDLLKMNGFRIHATHLGGIGYRRIVFDVSTGEVWVYHHLQSVHQPRPKSGDPF